MRVIAGSARGIPLQTVADPRTRPILDRVKKSLFSILENAGLLQGTRVLDLYSGTGTLGIEALSRGAASCRFVERNPEALKRLGENLAKTRLAECATLKRGDVGRALRDLAERPNAAAGPFELILYDPPFAFSREERSRLALDAELALAGTLLAPEGRLILRCEKQAAPPEPEGLVLARRWTDGRHAFCFFGKEPAL